MELKRILARDTRSATEKAMAMFGPDVLIISNHRVEGQTELIVALDVAEASLDEMLETDAEEQSQESNSVTVTAKGPRQPLSSTPSSVSSPFSDHLHQLLQPASRMAQQAEAEPIAHASTEHLLTQGREQVRSQEIVSLVREELAALRQEFRLSQQTANWQMNQYWPAHIQPLVQAMTEATVPTALRALLQEGLREQPTLDSALDSIRAQLTHNLERPQEGFPNKGVHVMAGLSGSGKTLMVAKAAQQVALHYGTEYVAVVSYHDMRAGAWSQTQMLCAQLGVDCFRAGSPETLKLLLDELSPRRMIVIDTPGVQMSERLAEILQVCPEAGLHAVVPADSSAVTLSRIMLKSKLPWQSLMISKLDEANSPWPLIQFLIAEGAQCVVSAGGGSDNISDGLKSSGLQKLINIAMTHLTPSSDAFVPDTMEDATKPATLVTQVNEADAANVPLTHTLGLSRPNWSLEMPQSELHG
ncbi:MAG: Signal recognition particle 54 kDa protein [Pseudomonadota bacterium]